jgi:hypothetical protein
MALRNLVPDEGLSPLAQPRSGLRRAPERVFRRPDRAKRGMVPEEGVEPTLALRRTGFCRRSVIHRLPL